MAYDPKGKSTKQLYEDRAKLHADAKSYHADNESAWTKEHDDTFNSMISDVSDVTAAIKRRESLADLEAAQQASGKIVQDDPMVNLGRKSDEQKPQLAVRMFSRDGKPHYEMVDCGPRGSQQYRKAFAQFLATGQREQMAALQSDSPTQAGYLLASEQMAAGILKDVDDLVFVRRYAKIHTVMEAGSLGIRKRTARMSTFDWSQELSISAEDTALTYGKRSLTPHHLTGMIKVSRDLVRRSMGGVEAEVRYEMARNAAEEMEDGYLLGSGAQQPLGVFTASNDGISTSRDVNTGSTTSITADGLLNAKYALKSQYRNEVLGPVRWLFHRDAIKIIAKLKDSTNQYLWQPGLQSGQPDRLLNFPVDESERCPNTFTDGNYVGLLANWQFYEIADALDMEMQVLYERYADSNQIGYIGRLKTDGMPTIEEAFVRVKCGS
jgi:HK97 family phage major capsid protein